MIDAVVFDLDGVLLDSEERWDQARRSVVAGHGGRWRQEATAAMQGMSSPEWARYLREDLGVGLPEQQLVDLVVDELLASYDSDLPLLPGAAEAVGRIGRRWPLALASSSNRVVIDHVLAVAGLGEAFTAVVSSEEVARGKPSPDVYLEALHRLGASPGRGVAVEDSANGIRAALAAGVRVVAIPNRQYPPAGEVLDLAQVVIDTLDHLTVEVIRGLDDDNRLDEEEAESFPASDPHSDWAGPSTAPG